MAKKINLQGTSYHTGKDILAVGINDNATDIEINSDTQINDVAVLNATIAALALTVSALAGRVTTLETESGKQESTIALSGVGGTATIGAAGGLTKVLSFTSDLTISAANFVTLYAADYLAVNIILTSRTDDLIFTSDYFGQEFTEPTIVTIVSDLDGSVVNTQVNVAAIAQIDTLTLTGTSGTANVGAAGGLTKLVTFALAGTTDLTQTATDFVASHAAAYAVERITIAAVGVTVVFTSLDAGTGFTNPTIVNVSGDLDGSIANTQINVVAVAQVDTITVTGTKGQTTVAAAGSLSKIGEFDTSLTVTNENFITDHEAAYLVEDIVVTSSTDTLIFTANVAGVGFTNPTITPLVADLDGTVTSSIV